MRCLRNNLLYCFRCGNIDPTQRSLTHTHTHTHTHNSLHSITILGFSLNIYLISITASSALYNHCQLSSQQEKWKGTINILDKLCPINHTKYQQHYRENQASPMQNSVICCKIFVEMTGDPMPTYWRTLWLVPRSVFQREMVLWDVLPWITDAPSCCQLTYKMGTRDKTSICTYVGISDSKPPLTSTTWSRNSRTRRQHFR